MAARAAELPRSPIFGIGRYQAGTERIDFEIGWDEFDRDTAWVQQQLVRTGLAKGDAVVITASAWEGPWTTPVLHALRALGVTYMPAEVFGFDAGRSAQFLIEFPVKAFIGLSPETIDGWIEKDFVPAELLKDVQVVWARPGAAVKLAELAERVVPFSTLGPALAMGVPGTPGAQVNAEEWRVEELNGHLVVSSVAHRAASFAQAPTHVRGTVAHVDEHNCAVMIGE